MPSPWNSLEVVKLVFSILTPAMIAFVGYWINRRIKELELERDKERDQQRKILTEQQRQYDEQRQKEKNELERRYKPHIEFHINCNFFGPEKDSYAAEFIITANNKSLIRHKFKSILLRVRGIKHNEPLSLFEEYEQRLKFPHPLFKTDIIPRSKDDQKGWNYIFVEPDVKQDISFISIIDKKYKYIVAQTMFHYDKYTPHSVERMFEVRAFQQTT